MMATPTLLMTAPGGTDAVLHAVDKKTGKRLGTVEAAGAWPIRDDGYLHEGKQYIVVQIMSPKHPGLARRAALAFLKRERR